VLSRAACILLLALPTLRAESSLIECIADAWYAPASKLDGSGKTLQLNGAGGAVLLAFRMAAVEHWKVEKAVIVLHLAAPSEPVELAVSLTGGAWQEYSRDPPPLRETTQTVEKVKPDGWISIAVPQAMAQALVDGKATGLALSSPGVNQTFHSRETIQYSPFFVVMGRAAGRPPSK
jgi:hypothetical protein